MDAPRAIVTGGAGFIGSTVVDALIARGSEVLVIDDLSRGNVHNLAAALERGARLERLDIRDGPAVAKEFLAFRPELVFHLAAQIDVRVSVAEPALDAQVNVLGAVNVLDAARQAEARRVVNTSTGGAIYGECDVVPTPESVAPDPMSPYGLSKHTVERYARWFRRAHELDVVTLRYGNVYGPRQDPGGDAGVVAIFCERLLRGRRPTVYGTGTQTRDYVYVGDIAAANLAAADASGLVHHEFNVGTGVEVSVLELLDTIAIAAGVRLDEVRPEFAPIRGGEVHRSCLDVSRARAELRLPPATPLPDGLAHTVAWIAGRPGG